MSVGSMEQETKSPRDCAGADDQREAAQTLKCGANMSRATKFSGKQAVTEETEADAHPPEFRELDEEEEAVIALFYRHVSVFAAKRWSSRMASQVPDDPTCNKLTRRCTIFAEIYPEAAEPCFRPSRGPSTAISRVLCFRALHSEGWRGEDIQGPRSQILS